MSLIYQALKQSEQRVSAAPVIALRARPTAQAAVLRPRSPTLNKALGWTVVVVALGISVGYFFSQGLRGQAQGATARGVPAAAEPALAQVAPSGVELATPTKSFSAAEATKQPTPSEERAAAVSLVSLPRALQPLPTMPLKLRMVERLPQAPKAASASPAQAAKNPVEPAVAVPTNTAKVTQASLPLSPAAAVLASSGTASVSAADTSASALSPKTSSAENVTALFDSLNQALAAHDQTAAQQHLRRIQDRLPDGSIARLRAEAWFAHQTGDLSAASRIYSLLLEKLPGDELSAINLVSIERKQNRPDQAKDVVKRALRYNPNSAALRSASDQLSVAKVAQ